VRFRGEAGTTVTGPWRATRTTALLWGQVDLDRSRRGGKGEPGKGGVMCIIDLHGGTEARVVGSHEGERNRTTAPRTERGGGSDPPTSTFVTLGELLISLLLL
jgi:hypothetical protein